MRKKEGAQLKLLIVDDLKSMREEFAVICRAEYPECRIDEAGDVVQAMQKMQKEIPPYDAVFTDVNMPEISGLKLISLIRGLPLYKETPLVVISTLSGRGDVDRAIQLGGNGYLIRPLRKEDFEVVRLAYLDPIQIRKRKAVSAGPEEIVKSLRKMLK